MCFGSHYIQLLVTPTACTNNCCPDRGASRCGPSGLSLSILLASQRGAVLDPFPEVQQLQPVGPKWNQPRWQGLMGFNGIQWDLMGFYCLMWKTGNNEQMMNKWFRMFRGLARNSFKFFISWQSEFYVKGDSTLAPIVLAGGTVSDLGNFKLFWHLASKYCTSHRSMASFTSPIITFLLELFLEVDSLLPPGTELWTWPNLSSTSSRLSWKWHDLLWIIINIQKCGLDIQQLPDMKDYVMGIKHNGIDKSKTKPML